MALVISRRSSDLTLDRTKDEDLSLTVALDELGRWLDDPRPYEPRHHRRAWLSMTEDVQQAITTRGPRLIAATPALSRLDEMVATPELGGDDNARQQAKDLRTASRSELGQAVIEAFDDLLDSLRDPGSTSDTATARLRAFESTLAATGRSLRSESSLLAGVLDNSAFDIAVARHQLDDTPMPLAMRPSHRDSAEVSADDRVALCHELLAHERSPGRQAVWVTYGNARLASSGWRVDFGPVTFFDGPAMLGLIDSVRSGVGGRREDLPDAIWGDGELGDPARRDLTWPKDVEHWVAVRVDLGTRRYADPVGAAWEQVDALVQVAGFHARGTSWERFTGHLFIEDGGLRGSSFPFGPPFDSRQMSDHTDEELFRLAPRLAPHLPVTNPLLAELLQISALVHDREHSADPTTLLQDVRAIELVASRCSTSWQALLTDYFAVGFARRNARLDVFNAVWTVAGDYELKTRVEGIPSPNELQRYLPEDHRRFQLRIDVALASLQPLAEAMPSHHAGSRHIRTLAAACADTTSLQTWVDETVEDYNRRVRRLKRCRDSLIHGGPISLDVATTVQRFANRQAQAVVATALEAVLQGQLIADEFTDHQVDDAAWRVAIGGADSVAESLFGQPEA